MRTTSTLWRGQKVDVRYYPPVCNSEFPWAHRWRAFLGADSFHYHAFRDGNRYHISETLPTDARTELEAILNA